MTIDLSSTTALDRIRAAGPDGPAVLKAIAPDVAAAIADEAAVGESHRQAELERLYRVAGLPPFGPFARLLDEAKADRTTTPAAFAARLLELASSATSQPAAPVLTPEVAQRRALSREIEADGRRARALASLGIPARFAGASFERFGGDAAALAFARNYVQRWPDVPTIVALAGPPGAGKTALSFALARALIEGRAPDVRWAGYPALARDWKLALRSRAAASRCDAYRRCDLLLVDGADVDRLDLRNPTRGPRRVIAERTADARPTLITTRAERLPDLIGAIDIDGARLIAASNGWVRLDGAAPAPARTGEGHGGRP